MGKKQGSNVYKRGSTYWCRFMVAGREFRFSLKTSDLGTARKRADQRREEVTAALRFGEHRTRYDEALKAWMAEVSTSLAPSTFKRYLVSLTQIDEHLSGLYVDQIDKRLLQHIIAKRREGGASNATIRRDLGALSSLLGFSEDHDWCKGNAAFDRLRRLKEKRDPIALPQPESFGAVVARCPRNLAAMVRTAAETGCRQAELTALRREHVDFARSQMMIVGKGNKRRTIPLTKAAVDAIRSAVPALGCPHVFQHDGKPYRNVATRFRKLVVLVQESAQKSGTAFRPFRFHDLRHLYAVTFLKEGRGSIYELQQLMGHSSIKVTELYLEFLTPEEKDRAKNRVGTKSGTYAAD